MNLVEAITEIELKGGRLCFSEETQKLLCIPPESASQEVRDFIRGNKADAIAYAKKTAGFVTQALMSIPGSQVVKVDCPKELAPYIGLVRAARADKMMDADAAKEIIDLFEETGARLNKQLKCNARLARLEVLFRWWEDCPGAEGDGFDPFKEI